MPRIEAFKWDDGGRSISGYVGMTGDCVTRSIAIATGLAYRDVYQALMDRYGSSPRRGVPERIYGPYLKERLWQGVKPANPTVALEDFDFSEGASIALIQDIHERKSHLCAVFDGVLYDTWDPRDDDSTYFVRQFWQPGQGATSNPRFRSGGGDVKHAGDLTQAEFEKIIHRLRAIDNTARNQAATESERENALRMMQSLLLRHNLTREDLADQDGEDSTSYARIACPVNGSKSQTWEKALANYVTEHIFPMTQWYAGRKGHRTLFHFYGPRTDVENAIALFRELLLTIASAAKILYGGYSRGSGASYAEGYVQSLPKSEGLSDDELDMASCKRDPLSAGKNSSHSAERALIKQRFLIVHERSRDWLYHECGVQLVTTTRRGRDFRDPAAELMGRKHGSEHRIDPPSAPKRLS
jgi:hypothetical protein